MNDFKVNMDIDGGPCLDITDTTRGTPVALQNHFFLHLGLSTGTLAKVFSTAVVPFFCPPTPC